MAVPPRPMLVTGATGYVGQRLIPGLVARGRAIRLGLVTIDQMIAALVHAIENPPPAGTARIVDVPAIRASGV